MTPREARDGAGGATGGGSTTRTGAGNGEAQNGAERVEVTDADRKRAFRALGWHESWGLDDLSDSDRNEVEDIAAALAEERAKARAPSREACDLAVAMIASKYRDPNMVRFAVNDYRDWLDAQ